MKFQKSINLAAYVVFCAMALAGSAHADPTVDFAKMKKIFGDIPLTVENVGELRYSAPEFQRDVTYKFNWEPIEAEGKTQTFTPLSFLASFGSYETIITLISSFNSIPRPKAETTKFYDTIAQGIEFRKAWELLDRVKKLDKSLGDYC